MDKETELSEKAFQLCSKFLCGEWKERNNFKLEELNGGLTNKLYICSTTNQEGLTKKVVLRIYGLIMQDVNAQITESVVFAILGQKGLGPKLYGAFSEGRLEEYIPGRNLRTAELQVPEISTTVATRLADYHRLEVPMSKDPILLEQFQGYYNRCEQLGVNMKPYKDPFKFCCQLIQNTKSPIVFCHNDCHEGNILIDQEKINKGSSMTESLRLIDFEYSAYGFRGFDFANHFNEWMMNYSNEEWPHYFFNQNDFPSNDQQRRFIQAYLQQQGDLSEENINKIQEEVMEFAMIGHVYWSLWSEIQAKVSDIKFGYVEYANDRMNAFRTLLNTRKISKSEETLRGPNEIAVH
ncbi:Oidioi.mRNA.OKI2018_I69.XSR.g15202.t2.cds [Oikopleura dioica]|uniref:ethanolamine kinase n=1 Tax=Oikopleura dioica TaxID=34765 RepID=A0ABN7SG62_OIKDI|nr:Oidioi.mRNA.OKI2018_I69.XSR.g15202.t2.cds [Oikopleura dioica]